MKNPSIISTTAYDVKHRDGNFNIWISKHDTGVIHAGILYYTYNKDRKSSALEPAFTLKYQPFASLTEEDAYGQCTKWIEENLKGPYEIIPTNLSCDIGFMNK